LSAKLAYEHTGPKEIINRHLLGGFPWRHPKRPGYDPDDLEFVDQCLFSCVREVAAVCKNREVDRIVGESPCAMSRPRTELPSRCCAWMDAT